jgi:outer membrane biosynthesis protein TonB
MPNFDSGNHKRTETDAEVTVLTDGSVGSVAIVESAGRTNDEPTIDALKHWKFKTAMRSRTSCRRFLCLH